MARGLVIFGNGLGMALESKYFNLASALQYAWTTSEHFSAPHKALVMSSIAGSTNAEFPDSEAQLEKLQLAIVASDFLKSLEIERIHWLNDNARELPRAFKIFVHEVATYFHQSDLTLPDEFLDPLAEFINNSKTHIAVLNYDNLLYDGLAKKGILNGYTGVLIDGFHSAGFAPANLDRYYPAQKGWYLHLHGSPLFVDNRKVMGTAARVFLAPTDKGHIVLTHVSHKPLIIDSSEILKEYWLRFEKALDEASQIFLFGYSGEDHHLNVGLRLHSDYRRINIIEWSGAGDFDMRTAHWQGILKGCKIKLIQMNNVLEFNAWNYVLEN